MASTYVNNLRLNEMATGDGAGTWGTTTNTNLELIGEALGYGTEAITTNADTHTSTVADGSTDAARAMYIKYTGTLDSACTITIGPNTMKRVQFIENATSGSQNIIISQGSGANITIPPGDVKVVYLDGAGSGAAVVDAFASLSVVDLKVQDDLTVTDDLIVNGDIDLEGNMDVNGSLETDALSLNGTTVTSTAAEINLLDGSSANTVVNSKAVIYGSSGQVAGTLSTAAQPNITSVGTLTGLSVNGNGIFTTSDNTDTLKLISTDADANQGPVLNLFRNSGSPADSDVLAQVIFAGENDADEEIDYARLQGFTVDVSDGTEDGGLNLQAVLAGTLRSRLKVNATELVLNDDSQDLDFRVESDGNANMLFVDGGNDQVFIGASSASALNNFGDDLVVVNTTAGTGAGISIIANATNGYSNVYFGDTDDGDIGRVQYNHNNNSMTFRTNTADALVIASDGAATFNSTVTANAGVVVDNITIDGNEIDVSSGDLTLDVAGDIILDADGGDIFFKNGGTAHGNFLLSGTDFTIGSSQNNGDLLFRGIGGGSNVTALTLDMSAGGDATFAAKVNVGENLLMNNNYEIRFKDSGGTERTAIELDSSNNFVVGTSASGVHKFVGGGGYIERFRINTDGSVVFNETSLDQDFRVESNGNTHMLFVDGGNNRVGIGTNAPQEQFSVQDGSGGIVFLGRTSGSTTGLLGRIEMGNTDIDSAMGGIDFTQDGATNSSRIGFFTQAAGGASTERLRISSAGNVGIGLTSNADEKLHIKDGALKIEHDTHPVIYFEDVGNSTSQIGVSGSGAGTDGVYIAGYAAVAAGTYDFKITGSNGSIQTRSTIYPATGIQLGSSASSNLLDDYEEGSWTGTLTGGTSAPSTAVTTTGYYTKIGNMVTLWIEFNNANVTGASGTVKITGQPFNPASAKSAVGGGFMGRAESDIIGSYMTSTSGGILFVDYLGNGANYATTGTGTYVQATITFAVS